MNLYEIKELENHTYYFVVAENLDKAMEKLKEKTNIKSTRARLVIKDINKVKETKVFKVDKTTDAFDELFKIIF